MGGNVGLVDMAKKGISTQLILSPDDHQQNVCRQYFMYYTYGIRRERQKVVVKSIGRYRKYPRVIQVFTCVKVRRARKQAKRLSMGNKHVQQSAGVLLFKIIPMKMMYYPDFFQTWHN